MAVTIEEAKAFIEDACKSRENWLNMANRSWDELKKLRKNGNLYSVSPNAIKRRARYPAWYSIFKIRQPLLLSRIGIPIGKDTTQDGNDNIGATAAICLERLAVSLAKTFDFFDVMCSARDDFLATCFGTVRGYYERDEIKETVKERIKPMQMPGSKDIVFVDGAGMIIESDDIGQDDEGYFYEHDEVIDVENEKICLESPLYRHVYIDPDIRRWTRCKRLAFEETYSEREFKEIFGAKAFLDIPVPNNKNPGADEATPKRQCIKVYEYWDYYERKVYWWAENGIQFIEPRDYYLPDQDSDGDRSEFEELNGLYNLEKFFPTPTPLVMNQATDEFWPIPEYYQIVEMIENIHSIFSRMMALTKAIRVRLMFDNNVEGLQEALNEATEGDAFGVPNLAQSLASAGGTLDNVVQYIPVQALIEGLQQMYIALESALTHLFKVTGTSDLLQGLSTDNSGKTLGERQIEEKYATNQILEAQRKMAEFVRGSYQLMCEMALKNFKDASLDMYIMPQTLQPEHQERYRGALGMLKDNQKRFRIELETDSTIALNEEYDKQMRVELVNTLTAAIEKTAGVAQQSPALVAIDLHAMKFLIQGFRQGKMFQNEITQSIDNVIAMTKNAPPVFNKDEAAAKAKQEELQINTQLEVQKLTLDAQTRQAELISNERLEIAKLQQDERVNQINAELEQFKLQSEQSFNFGQLQIQYEELKANIMQAQQELAAKRDELLVEMQKVTDKKEYESFKLGIDARVAEYEMQLGTAQQALETRFHMLDEQEKYATERRLQSEHQLQGMQAAMTLALQQKELQAPPEAPKAPPVTFNVEAPKPVKAPVSNIIRDASGNIISIESGKNIKNIKRDEMGNIVAIEHGSAE